jgi:hypothetical protein
VGFKGIFARWCARFASVSQDADVTSWLSRNAATAWDSRNAQGVAWSQWGQQTPEVVSSWECSSSLSIIVNTA